MYVLFQNLVGGMKKRLRGGFGRPWKTEIISPGKKMQGDHGIFFFFFLLIILLNIHRDLPVQSVSMTIGGGVMGVGRGRENMLVEIWYVIHLGNIQLQ